MYTPNCDIFWVGSYPFKDARSACRRVSRIPNMLLHWPQLPKRSSKEKMAAQTYSALANLPSDAFPRGVASGWGAMWKVIKNRKGSYFKTQIAGPITLFGKFQGSGMPSGQRLQDCVTLWLKHAYWQIDEIKENGFKPIIVLDEPMLPKYMGPSGSARAGRAIKLLRSIVKRLRKRGALVGVHCCNRVSPELLIELGVDLVHFDAYYFPTQIAAARQALQRFIADGGIVAWGVIPTNETLNTKLQVKLEKNLNNCLAAMETRGLPLKKVLAQSMIAPTCGAGHLTVDETNRILALASGISSELKKRHHLA